MKSTFITTVYNEQKTIIPFLESLYTQTVLPEEIIIVDAGSKDNTLKVISNFLKFNKTNKNIAIRVITKKGNRSVGRNTAINKARNEIILISDAGNILDKKWIENILKPFKQKDIDVVAGYYKGIAKNIFQKSLIPYVLVMPDKTNTDFLPATRSMAIKKSIWRKAGKFNEHFSHNEDYEFAKRLRKINAKIYFEKKAIVNWMPRQSFKSAFIMFFRFALGDIEAGILRTKVSLIFIRYLFIPYLIWLSIVYKSKLIMASILVMLILYLIWSVRKNYKYIKDPLGFIYLPALQITSDLAIISGSLVGFIKKLFSIDYLKNIKTNKYISLIIFIYFLTIMSTITWGLPNNQHPFTYHMDEWHFLGALKSVVKTGSAATQGGAYGPILYSLISAIFLIPFTILGFINPYGIHSSVTQLAEQRHIFEVLRLTTLIYGMLSIFIIYKTLKDFFTKNWIVGVLIFALNPLFLLWSGFYKHEIAVTFWVTLTIYLLIKYAIKQKPIHLFVAAATVAMSVATKLNAAPLIGIFLFCFLMFTNNLSSRLKELLIGMGIIIFTFILIGSPDIFTQFNSYIELLKPALFVGTQNFTLGMSWWEILLYIHYPAVFGNFTSLVTYISIIGFIFVLLVKFLSGKIVKYKIELFIILSFVILCLGLSTGKLGASNSRVLILLPLMAIMVNRLFDYFYYKNKWRRVILIVFIFGFAYQFIHTVSWLNLKYQTPIQDVSSRWVLANISKGKVIGLENIPIYQSIPDIFLKEFYEYQRNPKNNYLYKYEVVNDKSLQLPEYIVLTNTDIYMQYLKTSSKLDLLKRLKKEKYIKIKDFTYDYSLYNIFSNRFNLLGMNPMPGSLQISIYKNSTDTK